MKLLTQLSEKRNSQVFCAINCCNYGFRRIIFVKLSIIFAQGCIFFCLHPKGGGQNLSFHWVWGKNED